MLSENTAPTSAGRYPHKFRGSGFTMWRTAPVVRSRKANPSCSATTAPPPLRGTIVPTRAGMGYLHTLPVSTLCV